MSIQQYPNLLSSEETDQILSWLENRPYTKEKYAPGPDSTDILHYRNKNIDFHLPDSVVRQIVFPKLSELLQVPDLTPTHSAFLESHYPFSLHVDTVKTFENKQFSSTNGQSNDRAVLIALNESVNFQTIFFDLHADDLDQYYEKIPNMIPDLPAPMYDNVNDLGHLPNKARNLLQHYGIDRAEGVTWKKGMALSWSRQQMHCSSNFYNKGIKQALIMFF